MESHPPLEDWTGALRHTLVEGSYYWVVNEELVVIDATPDSADAMGQPMSAYIGSTTGAFDDIVLSPPRDERIEHHRRLFRAFDEGSRKVVRSLMWAEIPDQGHSVAVWESFCVQDCLTKRKYIINHATDVTSLDAQLDFLRAPAFQELKLMVIEHDGTCLAATNAAARFIDPNLTSGNMLKDVSIRQTEYHELEERQNEMVERSYIEGEPSETTEWFLDGSGRYRPYAVTRICFPNKRFMISWMLIPHDLPWQQLAEPGRLKTALKADNLRTPTGKHLSEGEFLELCREMHDDPVPKYDDPKKDKRERAKVDAARKRLKEKLGVSSTKKIKKAIAYTELEWLARVYPRDKH